MYKVNFLSTGSINKIRSAVVIFLTYYNGYHQI